MKEKYGSVKWDSSNGNDTEYEVCESVLIIHVNGELDHHNAVFIREKADEYIYSNKIKNIVFDFEKTRFMDSSGIGVIMGRYRMMKGINGKIGIINAGQSIRKILLYSGLNKIITSYCDRETAINEISR